MVSGVGGRYPRRYQNVSNYVPSSPSVRFHDGNALVNVDLSFPELANDLLRSKGFPDHLALFLILLT